MEIHEADFNRALWGWGWSKPDAEKIRNILEPMNEQDRLAVQKEYEQQNHGHNLRDDLKERLGESSNEYLKLTAILLRKDGKSDETGQVRSALNKLNVAATREAELPGLCYVVIDAASPLNSAANLCHLYQNLQNETDQANAEADICKSISALTSDNIKEFKDTYKQNYGVDIEAALRSDSDISALTKDALGILFKGVDKRTGSDPESIKNALDFARLGLTTGNIHL